MTENASFIPPNVMPPDPPEAKAVAFLFASTMTIVLLAFIGFVCFEFVADMAGRPLHFGVQQGSQETVDAEESLLAVGLLTPAHQSHVSGPRVLTMYRQRSPSQTPPLLLVNSRLHSWEEQYGDDTWYVWLELEMGEHHIQVEECEALFFVIPSAGIDL